MKVVILAGGLGSRLSEETQLKPKPMLNIGKKPIIWHIMKIYSYYGFNEFIICCGYLDYVIKEYFMNYAYHNSDLIINTKSNDVKILNKFNEDWKISIIFTGDKTNTGGRLKRIENLIKDKETFMMTYGDGLINLDINLLLESHKSSKKIATVTAVQPLGRFGTLDLDKNSVKGFVEKPKGDGQWMNGGFFVFEKEIFKYLSNGDETILEQEPLRKLALNDQLNSIKHNGFWQPMDTLRDKIHLNDLWNNDKAPWKIWKD